MQTERNYGNGQSRNGQTWERQPTEGAVLVCGLGSLGAECVSVLRRYGVPVRPSTSISKRRRWSQRRSGGSMRGDCRHVEVLRARRDRAGARDPAGDRRFAHQRRGGAGRAPAERRASASSRARAQDNISQLLTQRLTATSSPTSRADWRRGRWRWRRPAARSSATSTSTAGWCACCGGRSRSEPLAGRRDQGARVATASSCSITRAPSETSAASP